MGIITITRKTKKGAPIYDTINLADFQRYKKQGWKIIKNNL